MTDIWIKAFQLILSLSILVILHELGHFIPARLFKTRVEKFYLFFDPWFSLFKFKKGDTEYGIGWLPLGGYVKISGMIDESMDKEQMNQPAQPWEFRAKPAWQRLIIMVGGVTVNLILGVMIYAMVLFAYGDKYLPNDELKNGVWCIDSLAQEIGFQNGDKIVAINGKSIEKFNDIMPELLLAGYVDVDRNGEQIKIDVPSDFIERIINNESKQFFYPRVPTIVKAFPDTSAAKLAGLLEKDKIVGINGKEILFFDAFKQELANFKGQEVSVMVERDGERKEFPVVVSDKGSIGIEIGIASLTDMEKMGLYNLKTSEFGFFESIPAGFNKAIEKLTFYVRQFKLILNPSTGAYKGVGGFGSIGGLFPAEWDWESFWEITAFLSLILAFMNILPIPALDGGHVMFLLYEIIFRRKPNEKFMEYAQMAGMILLLALLIVSNGNDIFKLFR